MNDDDFWTEYIAEVKPLKKNQRHIFISNNDVKINSTLHFTVTETKHTSLMSIDRTILDKIKKRKLFIDATIDLHGYFLDDAFNVLAAFIKNQYSMGHKLLLVITGKSKTLSNQPTIRTSIKDWIENSELLNIVHSISDAALFHGGRGAVYLKLRRKA